MNMSNVLLLSSCILIRCLSFGGRFGTRPRYHSWLKHDPRELIPHLFNKRIALDLSLERRADFIHLRIWYTIPYVW